MTTSTKTARPSFSAACSSFVHRFTLDHVPAWSQEQRSDGTYYAPHYRSDAEWYENTLFEGEHELANSQFCYSTNQTWPLGQSLSAPYRG